MDPLEPISKRMKFDSSLHTDMRDCTSDCNYSYILEYIHGDEYLATEESIDLVNAVYAPLLCKQNATKVLSILNDSYPFPKCLKQLKRIRVASDNSTLEILLFVAKIGFHSDIIKELSAHAKPIPSNVLKTYCNLDGLIDMIGPLHFTEIPTILPLTRKQFELCKKYWSFSFHENKELEAKMNGDIFVDDKQRQSFAECMKTAHFVSKLSNDAPTKCALGAVISDPKSSTIMATAYDLTNNSNTQIKHPLHHAPMVVIDMLALSQGGGSCSYKPLLSDKPSIIDGLYFKPFNKIQNYEGTGYKHEGKCASPESYIGTGLHVFLTCEPCVMCSMALLHTRVKCVFYESTNYEGGLGTLYKINTLKDLNHKFDVYKCVQKASY